MSPLTPGQAAWRRRVEALIGLATPALDLVLAVGDRVSRIAEPSDHEHYPVRAGGESALPGGFDSSRDSSPVGEDDSAA